MIIYIYICALCLSSPLQGPSTKELLFLLSFRSLCEAMGRAQLASVFSLLVTPMQVSWFACIYINTWIRVIQHIPTTFQKKHVKVYVLANSPRIFSNE